MDFKMKKSLFSLLILSTLSLSTQAIAQQIHLGGYNIDIQGRVIDEKLTCVVQDIAPIQLDDAYVDSLLLTPEKRFSVDFSGCTNQARDRKVKVVFGQQNTTHLMNTGSTENDTNARVALLRSTGELVPLNGENSERTFSSEVAGEHGSLEFLLKYDRPASIDDAVTAGAFKATLSLDAYVTDDIQ
ncbi:TPA: type 1 fimbrial protein [Proteus mirabilis]|nr:type 1 fimbrial protein [Proteus mirabilis]HEI9879522.1 type 1 fimbrial protein [Proteus mirabilis]HEJ9423703.1 type 1 fimbrial protein [Proteus mirabilis]HEJ9452116.1 type 1 fimbrial protein [Proteus mirabilis]HEJ9463745.1 type 1 fimbrial protein [Proteus mirabilis]